MKKIYIFIIGHGSQGNIGYLCRIKARGRQTRLIYEGSAKFYISIVDSDCANVPVWL